MSNIPTKITDRACPNCHETDSVVLVRDESFVNGPARYGCTRCDSTFDEGQEYVVEDDDVEDESVTIIEQPSLFDDHPVRLVGWGPFEDLQGSIRSGIFGQMVLRSQPVTQHYHGDLYHDARWLARHVTGPCVFWYAPREWGTNIGTDRELVGAQGHDPTLVLYRVEVTCKETEHSTGGEWFVRFVPEQA